MARWYNCSMENSPVPGLAIDVFDGINLFESTRIKKIENGRVVGESRSRDKISGKTKRRTHDLLSFDRSDPDVTVKHHHVQEFDAAGRSEEHTSELQSLRHLVCRLLLEKKKKQTKLLAIREFAISDFYPLHADFPRS